MPDVWMPGLIHDPRDVGNPYPRGRNRMDWAVHHDTGGSNSYSICKFGRAGYNNSLCNVLFPKEGTPWQFCPIDSLTFHGGSSADYDGDGDPDDYNPYGPGFEVERFQGEPLSADQIMWLGRLGVWLRDEWNIPMVQYDGPFGGADEPTLFRGHINHRDFHPNPDGLSPDEWNLIVSSVGGSPSFSIDERTGRMIVVTHNQGHTDLFTVAADNKVWWKHNDNKPVILTVNGNAKFPEITKDGESTIFFRGPDSKNGEPTFVRADNSGFGWVAKFV